MNENKIVILKMNGRAMIRAVCGVKVSNGK